MPNWCISTMVVYPKKRDAESLLMLKNFHKTISNVIEEQDRIPEGQTKKWDLYVVYEKAFPKLSEEEILGGGNFVRGNLLCCEIENKNFNEVDNINDATFVRVDYESAWNPMNDGWDEIIEELGKGLLAQVTISEECGCGLYINTDKEKRFLKEEWYLDVDTEFDCEGHYLTTEELIDYFNQTIKDKNFKTVEEIKKFVMEYNDSEESENKGYYISLHSFFDED